jgi:flagellar biosynthesis/type III secretory pathway protein FliH
MSSRALIENRADIVQAFAWNVVAPAEAQNFTTPADHSAPPPAKFDAAVEERISAARQSGLQEGEAAGRAKAQAEVRAAMDRLAQSIADLDEFRGTLYRQTEVKAVRLSIAIARPLLRPETSGSDVG